MTKNYFPRQMSESAYRHLFGYKKALATRPGNWSNWCKRDPSGSYYRLSNTSSTLQLSVKLLFLTEVTIYSKVIQMMKKATK